MQEIYSATHITMILIVILWIALRCKVFREGVPGGYGALYGRLLRAVITITFAYQLPSLPVIVLHLSSALRL